MAKIQNLLFLIIILVVGCKSPDTLGIMGRGVPIPVPGTYRFTISSTPSGADVYLYEDYKGKTPIEWKRSLLLQTIEKIEIRASLEGYEDGVVSGFNYTAKPSYTKNAKVLSWGAGVSIAFDLPLRADINLRKKSKEASVDKLFNQKENALALLTDNSLDGDPSSNEIIQGLNRVETGEYEQAVDHLQAGLSLLRQSPSFTESSDSLVIKEAEYIQKLINQITSAKQKGVFSSSNPMAEIIISSIKTQAKVIKSIDERRRKQSSPTLTDKSLQKEHQSEKKDTVPATLSTSDSNSKVLAEPKPVVGVKESEIFATEKLKNKIATLDAGTQVSVTQERDWVLLISTQDGKKGWLRRCHLCTANEYNRRKKDNEIPTMVTYVGAEKDGRTFMYGPMQIKNNRITVVANQAFWLDESAKDKSFTVASHQLIGDPYVLFLYNNDDRIATLRIWRGEKTK